MDVGGSHTNSMSHQSQYVGSVVENSNDGSLFGSSGDNRVSDQKEVGTAFSVMSVGGGKKTCPLWCWMITEVNIV